MDAGKLTKRASFEIPYEDTDADGHTIQTFLPAFTAWVHVRWLRGGESVMQARLASKSPAIVTFRNQQAAEDMTSEWRVIIDGKVHELKEPPRESQDRAFLEVLVERIE